MKNKIPFAKDLLAVVLIILLGAVVIIGFIQLKKYDTDTIQPANIGDKRILVLANNRTDRQAIEASWNSEMGKRIDAWADQINKARVYEKAGNYELAEIEFKKAIEADPSDQGVPRRGLARIYEASGQYQKALDQINWLLERTSRPDVKNDLLARKQNLEQLLAEQTTKQPNQT